MKNLRVSESNIKCIPKTEEKTSLPSQDKFYSKLSNEGISDADYGRACNVWNTFNMRTMRDYHDLYLETDVLPLADIMENFRNVCKTNYGLDAWDAALKMTGVSLDLLSDPNMYLMVENGIRGGISTITKRYGNANNKYMDNYNPEEEKRVSTLYRRKQPIRVGNE